MASATPTEALVDEILESEKTISADINWSYNPSHDANWAKFTAVVENECGWDLILYGNAQLHPQDQQPKRSFSLVLNRTHRIYALDVNGVHKNKVINDEEWNYRTHKQRWKDGYGMQFAYTPPEYIPEEPDDAFFEFCGECNIVFGGQIQGLLAV